VPTLHCCLLERVTKQRAILCIVRVLGIPTRNTGVCTGVFCGVAWGSFLAGDRLSCSAAYAAGSAPFLPSLCLGASVLQQCCAAVGCQRATLCGSPPPCEVGSAAAAPRRCLLQWWPKPRLPGALCGSSEVLVVAVSSYAWYRSVSVMSGGAFCYVYSNQGIWIPKTSCRCFPLTYWFGRLEALKCSCPRAEHHLNSADQERCCFMRQQCSQPCLSRPCSGRVLAGALVVLLSPAVASLSSSPPCVGCQALVYEFLLTAPV